MSKNQIITSKIESIEYIFHSKNAYLKGKIAMTDIGIALLCGFAFGFVVGMGFAVLLIASYGIQGDNHDE